VQRRQGLDVLLSFNPFWLRLAVEVVTQKPVQLSGGARRASVCVCVVWLRHPPSSQPTPLLPCTCAAPPTTDRQRRQPAATARQPPARTRHSLRRCGPSC
jgi:hypothetical protein